MHPEEPVTTAVDLSEVSFPAWPAPSSIANAFDDTLVRAWERLERMAPVVLLVQLACVPLLIAAGAVITLFALLVGTVFSPVVAVALAWYAARRDRHAAVAGSPLCPVRAGAGAG